MKTILQINILNESGSTGRVMQGLSKIIKKNGMKSYTAYGYGKSTTNNSVFIGNRFSYYTHNICSRVFGNQGKYSYFPTRRFLKKVDKIKPDIIHLHNIHGNYINYPLLFEYIVKNNISLVWTLHDCWPFTGRCTYYQMANCQQWEKSCEYCKNTKDYPSSLFRKRVKKQFEDKKELFTKVNRLYIVTPSKWLKEEVSKSFLRIYPIEVINNGIDVSVFHFAPQNFRNKYKLEDKFIILGIAHQWDARKGLADFILLNQLLKENEKIVLVGLSETQISNLPEGILGISKTENIHELVGIYSESDVFVNFTYEDNFPTVNMEAMGCGLPVYTYDTGGSPESVLSEQYVIAQGDVTGMYEKISQFKDSNNKDEIRKQCVKKVYENYQADIQFEKYLDIYEKMENVNGNLFG